jgi:hypothetical protein
MDDIELYRITFVLNNGDNQITLVVNDSAMESIKYEYESAVSANYIIDITPYLENDPDTDYVLNWINPRFVSQFTIERYYGDEDE